MTRSQRILRYIARCKKPAPLHAIAKAVATPDDARDHRYRTKVAAHLHQLLKADKLTRSGKPMAYTYAANDRTLVDGRKIDRNGTPRTRSQERRPSRAQVVKPPSKPKAKPARAKGAAKTAPAERFVITRTTTGAGSGRAAGQRESVQEFLARGGRIQKLANGATSTPMFESVRALNDKSMRKRLVAADNDSLDDLDDNTVAA